jgi:hypothetical protein
MMIESGSDGGAPEDLAIESPPDQDLATPPDLTVPKGTWQDPRVGVQPGGCRCDLGHGSPATGSALLFVVIALFLRRRASHH